MPLLQTILLGTALASLPAAAFGEPPTPLLHAHAHNDYYHREPLHDALAEGFTSVEADIFLKDGELLVGHDWRELRPDRTLESLYLDPLVKLFEREDAAFWTAERPFLLFVDIKGDPSLTRKRLTEVLSKYHLLLTASETSPRAAVQIVISGSPPRRGVVYEGDRLAGADGRVSDLGSGAPSAQMPVISDRWGKHFTWTGEGQMPEPEQVKLLRLVELTHAEGKLLRFWATPEDERVWQVLLTSGVDLINTDQLARLQGFLRQRLHSASAAQPTR